MKNTNKYPVYIVSKGRAERPYTAEMLYDDGVDFRIVVEPAEAQAYREALPYARVEVLPFENLGVGSYPARNWCWEHSLTLGAHRHWVLDDNIRGFMRLHQGNRRYINAQTALHYMERFVDRYTNVAIAGPDYNYLISPTESKPFKLNRHVYSAMLIENSLPFRWRLKYNEDVDLCLQALTQGYCTVLFYTFLIDKISTTAKLPGGNQTELYQGNDPKKKLEKARTLYRQWPNLVQIVQRYNRPHHYVDWNQFTQPLDRRDDLDWTKIAAESPQLTLVSLPKSTTEN